MAAPGQQVQYPNENEGGRILGATLTITALALITMIARLYVRLRIIRNVGLDDYFMCLAMVLCIVGQSIIIPQVYYGGGRHIDRISPLDFQKGFKLNFISQPFYLWGICIAKISVGFFLLRIAATALYRRAIIGVMVFMGVYTLGCFLTIMFQCTNLAVQWDPKAKGTCWTPQTLKTLGLTNIGFNITTDILFSLVIPIPMLWDVQMNRRQKASVVGILSLGIFATAAALIKVTYLGTYGKTGDWLWDSRNITIWTVIECNIGIVAGNLPALKPLFRTILGSTYGRGSQRNTGSKPMPGHSYGRGTGLRSTGKDAYNSLGSKSGSGRPLSPYAAYEAHVMATLADKQAASDKSKAESINSGHEGSTGGSADSIELLDEQPKPWGIGKLGGIMKTTEVTQERDGDSLKPEHGAKHMV